MQDVFYCPDCGADYGCMWPGDWKCNRKGCSGNLRKGQPPRIGKKSLARKEAPILRKPARHRRAVGRKKSTRTHTKRAVTEPVFYCPKCRTRYGPKYPGSWHCKQKGCKGNLRKGTPPVGGTKGAPKRAPAKGRTSKKQIGGQASKKHSGKPARAMPDLSALKGADLIAAGDLQGHIEFIREFANAHSWSKATRKRIRDDLKRLEQRWADPNLYMGVVGEFSSGKSTFINALLRDDLLKTDVLQATTAAVTQLRYGPALDVAVTRKDGSSRQLAKKQAFWSWLKDVYDGSSIRKREDRIRDFIHKATAVESIAETLEDVTVFHPSPLVAKQVVIVDTPGANAENQRHVVVAQCALTERCDAAIILVPADQPLSSSLVKFIQESLADVLHRCAFVVTKLDTIRRVKDREVLLRNIRARIGQTLGMEKPRVMGIAARVVVDQITGEDDGLSATKRDRFVEQFGEFETQMYTELERQRKLIQAERLSTLAANLMAWLPEELEKQEQAHEKRHTALAENRIPDLGSFIEESVDRHQRHLRLAASTHRGELLRDCDRIRSETLQRIERRVNSIPEESRFGGFVDRQVKPALTDALAATERALDDASDGICEVADAEIESFQVEFEKVYRSLSRVALQSEFVIHVHQIGLDVGVGSEAAAVSSVQESVESANTTTAYSAGGFALAGASLGSFAFPIVGTALGAAVGAGIGGLLGAFFGPSIEELQADYWKKLKPDVTSALNKLRSEAHTAFESSLIEAEGAVETVMAEYFQQYEKLVGEMVAADEEESGVLEQMRDQINSDREELGFRKEALDRWREALKKA